MFKQKCPGCAKKLDSKFGFCPWCGQAVKQHNEQKNFGLLGRSDNVENPQQLPMNQNNLPLGLGKVVDSLMKQLEKEFSGMNGQGMPKGFNIKIQTGNPKQMNPQLQQNKQQEQQITPEESQRRQNLPKQDAESRVKRLSDKIIYEIHTPGIKKKEDIVITKLEQGFEIKVYTNDICYSKTIPLKIEIMGYSIQKDKLIVELQN
jgi:hypothetical protein